MLRSAIACALLLSLAPALAPAEPEAEAEFFEKEIRPLLISRCQECHGTGKEIKGGLKLTSRGAIMSGGETGPAVVPGKSKESLLIEAVRYQGLEMPPKGKLPDEEIAKLARWIDAGAIWPGSETAVEEEASAGRQFTISPAQRGHWSFQPLKKAPPPAVKDAAWPAVDIDRYVLAAQEAKGLQPAKPAEKRVLLRRATFDLIGLPPTPEELQAFLADESPAAYEKLVDRLLASPHYGERWGRHWLDVVRYADTAGETADYPVPEAYKYRNYVIDSFNRDKPYDEFLREQIAGDLLAKQGPPEKVAERTVATGYIAISRRFGFDSQNYQHLTIADTLDTLGRSALGLSIGCARCHDHKYDPISAADYYALYGIFAGTKYAFPGSEEKKVPADFIPLGGPGDLAYGVSEGTPQNARIQKRGELTRLGAEVPRRFLEILGGEALPADSKSSGRLELAGWLTKPDNPLTARVIVNRVWQQHFGRGLVATPSDFGLRGQPPSHPELLDYLAAWFMEHGWSIKALHRQIMLSRTYQMAGEADLRGLEVDPGNLLLWKFDRRRLDAESLRDSLLAASGELDRTPGGPHPFPEAKAWNFTQHAPFKAVYETKHRSVYLMTQRLGRHPFLALFDGADPNTSTAQRSMTITPTQALFMMNDPLVHEQTAILATRLLAAQSDDAARIGQLYRLLLTREPTDADRAQCSDFLERYRQRLTAINLPADAQPTAAWAALARVLVTSNEFVYVD